MTGLPDLDVARVRRYCEERVPQEARYQVRMECEVTSRHLTLVERRAPWREEYGPEWTRRPIARLTYTPGTGAWTPYWVDRNAKFHRYERVPPTADIQILLDEIEADPIAIFWG